MTLLRLTPAMATHRGMRRKINEDAIAYEYPADSHVIQSHGAMFVVADGVGGLSSGDKASQMTVEEIIRRYYDCDTPDDIEQCLVTVLQAVNLGVYKTLQGEGATTVVLALIIDARLIIVSAGDSQIFRIRGDDIQQLNDEDVLHTNDSKNGALTKAIGYRETIDIDVQSVSIAPGDKILLCSDGLTRYLNESKLVELSNLRDPRDSVRRMINQVNHAGGADNVSVILIEVGDTIEADKVAEHIKRTSVRVSVDTDPMIMFDVPSKPTTQIPLSRPETNIEDYLPDISELETAPAPPAPVRPPVQIKQDPPQAQSSSKGMMIVIVVAIAILVIGAVIIGFALASSL